MRNQPTPTLQHERLASLLRYLTPEPSDRRALCFPRTRPLGAIYWPDVFDPGWPHAFDNLVRRLFPSRNRREPHQTLLLQARDAGLNVPPKNHDEAHELLLWKQGAVRREVETLLGPLKVSETSPLVSMLLNESVARLRVAAGKTPLDQSPLQHEDARLDPVNFTFFRLIHASTKAAKRVLTYPPALDEVGKYQSELPLPRQFLFLAIEALFYQGPLDPETTGLSFTDDGFVFINWRRLYDSPYWPLVKLSAQEAIERKRAEGRGQQVIPVHSTKGHPDSPFHPDNLPHTILQDAKRSPARFASALVPHDVTKRISHLPARMAVNPLTASRFVRMASQTGCFAWSESETDPCSIVDPLKLASVPALFDGAAYLRYTKRQQHNQRERARAIDGETPISRPGAKVYMFPFRPAKYIDELRRVHPRPDDLPRQMWFGPNDTEVIYAVRKREGFFFSLPSRLSAKLEHTAPGEIETWCRALDSLKVLERVHTTDDLFNFEEQRQGWRSRFYRGLKADLVKQVATSVIRDFTSIEDLTRQQMGEVMTRLRHQFAEETGEGGQRWHYRLCANAAKEITNPHMVRRILNVVLPDTASLEPQPVHFYTPFAVNIFERFAKVSVGLLSNDVLSQDGPMNRVYDIQQPAFYIYAWTQFCKENMHSGAGATDFKRAEANPTRWTPDEDLTLFMHFRKPRMNNGAWVAALSDIFNVRGRDVDRTAAYRRTRVCNKMLKDALHPSFFRKYSFGGHLGLGAQAAQEQGKRTVLLIGYLLYHQRVYGKIYRQLPNVLGILNRPAEDILSVTLPEVYTDRFFVEFH